MKKTKHKAYRSARPFMEKLLRDPEVRVHFEAERAISLIAQTVQAARLRTGLTQTELAKRVGTTQTVVNRIESGSDSRTPSLDLLSRIV